MNIKKTFILLILVMFMVGCSSSNGTSPNTNEDALKFKEEYEALNGTSNTNNVLYMDVEIADDNRFVYATQQEILDIFNGGTGVIYFGFPECPWCRNTVNVIDEAAKSVSLGKIYYMNVSEMRDTLTLDDDGEIVVEDEGSEFYREVLGLLGNYAPVYPGLNDDLYRRILVPLVVSVVNGEIVSSHMGTVDSQDNPYEALDETQYDELFSIYKDAFIQVVSCGVDFENQDEAGAC